MLGIAVKNFKQLEIGVESSNEQWAIICDECLRELATAFLSHVMKMLNIFHHILDEIVPTLPQNKPVLPNLPTASSLSPMKRRKSELDKTKTILPGKLLEKEEKPEKKNDTVKVNAMGYFANVPHYMKIYELLRSAYTNYKVHSNE